MTFGINIKHDRKNIRLLVEKISETKTQEKYKVIARNQSFILGNNRPLLIAKGLKYFPVKWRVIVGAVNNAHILEQITKAIENKITYT